MKIMQTIMLLSLMGAPYGMVHAAKKGIKTMQDIIFREYDIRGKVGTELVIDEVADLARAIAFYFVSKKPGVKKVALGMDGRLHSPAIKNQIVKGLTESGLDVVFIGVCTTPVMYFGMHNTPVDAGLMITASHNPKEYNGLKIMLGKEGVSGASIQEIRRLFHESRSLTPHETGTYIEKPLVSTYVKWITDHFKHLKGLKISAVVDCGNGAGGTVMPDLIKRMGWANVMLQYGEVDGTYPHHEADPTVEKNMSDVKDILASTNIAIGIGLDGDCDRMAPMTKSGFLVPGDQLLALYAHKVVQEHPGANVVFDIKSSSALIETLEKMGAVPRISPSGHSIIKNSMKEYGALLAGELSCHFFFHDRYFGYDDGIYAMMRLFELLHETGKTLEELLANVPKKISSREYRIACEDAMKQQIVAAIKNDLLQRPDVQALTIDGVRATMPYGWGLVRASNTQPALTIRFESDTYEGLDRVKQDFYTVLMPYFDPAWLKQQLEMA